jgi:hypothetical protein
MRLVSGTVKALISSLGGQNAVARELGISVSAVHHWTKADAVPDWRVESLTALCRRKKVEVSFTNAPAQPSALVPTEADHTGNLPDSHCMESTRNGPVA